MHARSLAWHLTTLWVPFAALCVLFASSCDDSTAPPTPTTITVWAHEGDIDVPGIQAEVLQTELSGATGADGRVTFTVEPGEYTVRVHTSPDHNLAYFDHHVNVRQGDQAIIDADYSWSVR